VNNGRKVSAAGIRRELNNHEEKQRKTQVSQVLTAGEIGTEAGDTRPPSNWLTKAGAT
jgi:hypothetical protein